MFRDRWHAIPAVLTFLAAVCLAGPARAGLTIEIVDPDAGPVRMVDNDAFDTDAEPGVIAVNVELLNLLLINFNFTSLRATSNSPSGDVRPLLSISGTVLRAADAPRRSTVAIRVSDADFNYAGVVRLRTSASATFSNTARGDRYASQSFLDTGNAILGRSVTGAKLIDTPFDPSRPEEIPIALAQNAKPTHPGPRRALLVDRPGRGHAREVGHPRRAQECLFLGHYNRDEGVSRSARSGRGRSRIRRAAAVPSRHATGPTQRPTDRNLPRRQARLRDPTAPCPTRPGGINSEPFDAATRR